jgi:hypothetical protein
MGLTAILPVLLRLTGSRLVLRLLYYIDLILIHPVLLHLQIQESYYVEFTAWALLPYCL